MRSRADHPPLRDDAVEHGCPVSTLALNDRRKGVEPAWVYDLITSLQLNDDAVVERSSARILRAVSRDGRWIVGWAPLPSGEGAGLQAFSLSGQRSVSISNHIDWSWSPRGDSFSISGGPVAAGHSYVIPLRAGEALPPIPGAGFVSEHDVAQLPGARRIDALTVPGSSPDVYAFYRGTTQRNLYRIPVQ